MAGVTVSIRRLDLGLEDNASFAAKLAAARLGDDSAGGRWREPTEQADGIQP